MTKGRGFRLSPGRRASARRACSTASRASPRRRVCWDLTAAAVANTCRGSPSCWRTAPSASSRRASAPSGPPVSIRAAAYQTMRSGRRRIASLDSLPSQPSSVATSPRYQVCPMPRSISRAARSWSPAENACSMAEDDPPFCSFQSEASRCSSPTRQGLSRSRRSRGPFSGGVPPGPRAGRPPGCSFRCRWARRWR